MIPKISLITILTDDIEKMLKFYKEVLGFTSEDESGDYIEFNHDGVRFAICSRKLGYDLSGDESYRAEKSGQSFELAFWVPNKEEVDKVYDELIEKGATPIKRPVDMPWGQRTGLFADPDGNIHEIYAD